MFQRTHNRFQECCRPAVVSLLILLGTTIAAATLMAQTGPTGRKMSPQTAPAEDTGAGDVASPVTKLSRIQKEALLRDNFNKMKQSADELAQLAKSLQDDLDKSGERVLSIKVLDDADKIEKLAKKIKGSAKSY